MLKGVTRAQGIRPGRRAGDKPGQRVKRARQDLEQRQTFDLSGRRGLRVDAAERRTDVARARGASARLTLEVEVRVRFHEPLAAERRVASVRGALRRTDDLGLVVGRRQAAGDASGYDRGRVERERSALSARLAVEEAGLSRARARLAGLLGGGAGSPGWRPAG